jgi:hypothetical protein
MATELGATQAEAQETVQKAVQKAVQKTEVKYRGGSPDTVYGMGVIGAWVYYLRRAETWRERAAGLGKGLFWPAFMVYAVLKFLEKE